MVFGTSCVSFPMPVSCFVYKLFYNMKEKMVSSLNLIFIRKIFFNRLTAMASYQNLYTNLFTYPLYIGVCLWLMLIYSVIYLVLAIYIERVNPGGFGVAQPWYYLFKKSNWNPRAIATVQPVFANGSTKLKKRTIFNQNHWIEYDAKEYIKSPAVTLSHLTKVNSQFFISQIQITSICIEIWKLCSS